MNIKKPIPQPIAKVSSSSKTPPKELKNDFNINKTSCIVKIGNDLIIDKIKLINKFGSNSSFGINYISSFIDDDKFKFSSKIQLNSATAELELYLMKVISDHRKKTNNLHLPFLYGYTKCPLSKINNKDDLPDLIKTSKNKGYTIIFNELLLGDLKHYLYNIAKDNYDLWLNAIEQIYISIASLHELGILHNDSHYGNFLYKKIEKGGYFQYIINGKDYYIPNLGYIWVIWDLGVCGPIHRHYDYMVDYNHLNLYLRYDNKDLITEDFKFKFALEKPGTYRSWGYINKSLLTIPKEIDKLIDLLWINTGTDNNNISKNLYKNKTTEDKWFEYLFDNKLLFNYKPTKDVVNVIKLNYQHLNNDLSFLLDNSLFLITKKHINKFIGK